MKLRGTAYKAASWSLTAVKLKVASTANVKETTHWVVVLLALVLTVRFDEPESTISGCAPLNTPLTPGQ